MSFILDVVGELDTWTTLQIYQGAGNLSAWGSFKVIAFYLFGLGLTIRGVVLLFRAIQSPTPGETMKSLINLVVTIAVFVVLWKISGL